mgnify:FL=1
MLFWRLVSFGIVFLVLARKGFPVITRMVDKRRDYIQKSIEAADEANRQLENVKAEAQQIVDEAHRQQAEILKKAVAESEQIVQNAQAKASSETEKQLEAARQRIGNMKAKAMADINSEVAMLSVEIAEKVLRHELNNKEHQEGLILQMLEEAEDIRRKRSHLEQEN